MASRFFPSFLTFFLCPEQNTLTIFSKMQVLLNCFPSAGWDTNIAGIWPISFEPALKAKGTNEMGKDKGYGRGDQIIIINPNSQIHVWSLKQSFHSRDKLRTTSKSALARSKCPQHTSPFSSYPLQLCPSWPTCKGFQASSRDSWHQLHNSSATANLVSSSLQFQFSPQFS